MAFLVYYIKYNELELLSLFYQNDYEINIDNLKKVNRMTVDLLNYLLMRIRVEFLMMISVLK